MTEPMGQRRRRWGLLPRLALAGTALVCCLIGAECALRIYIAARGWTANCYAAQLELFRPHPENGYDLRPGFRLRSGRYAIAIDSRGLRGPEVADAKPSGVRRIVVLGESAAFGYFVSDGQEAARLLERKLRMAGRQVEVVNAGVPGYSLRQIIRRFREVVAPLHPDIAIAYLGWNDLPAITAEDPDADRFERLPIASAWERALGKSALYGFVAYRLRGPVQLAPAHWTGTVPTAAGRRRFRSDLDALAEAAREAGVKLIVCTQAMAAHPKVGSDLRLSLGADARVVDATIELGKLLHDELEEFARRCGLGMIDVYRQIEPTTENLGDYVHLTARGEERLATIWSTLLPELW